VGRTFYTESPYGGIAFRSERRPGDVRIPNYVFDIWMPLLGAVAIGVYGTYCRLEMGGAVKKITLASLAKACRIGVERLGKINAQLEECGFIRVNKPTGTARLMHWTTEIVVLDPPTDISQELLHKYAAPSGYEVLTPWLAESPENPNGFSDEPRQESRSDPNPEPNIETLDILEPLSIEDNGAAFQAAREPSPVEDLVYVDADDVWGQGTDPPTELEKLLQHSFGFRDKRMARGQAKRLLQAVTVGDKKNPGRLKELPGPAALYDSDPDFADYVAEGIKWALGPDSFGDKPMSLAARRNACIGWIRKYDRPFNGWLARKEGGNGTDRRRDASTGRGKRVTEKPPRKKDKYWKQIERWLEKEPAAL